MNGHRRKTMQFTMDSQSVSQAFDHDLLSLERTWTTIKDTGIASGAADAGGEMKSGSLP